MAFPAVAGVVPPARELPVVSARGSPAHPRRARTPAGSSCGRSVRYRIQVPGPGPVLPAAPMQELCPSTRAILARLSAIPHAPFGGGPRPFTSRSPASNDCRTAPRHTASSHYIWPTVTPRLDPRAERRHPCAPRPPTHLHWSNWRRLPAQNWRCFFARYHTNPNPTCGLECVPNVARDYTPRIALSTSFGFGGQNRALVMKAI